MNKKILSVILTGALGVSLFAMHGHAATLVGNYSQTNGTTVYDLDVLGELDWAIWNKTGNPDTGAPTYSLSGGTLINDVTAFGGGSLRGTSATTTADFSYDGGSTQRSNVTGIFNTQLQTDGAGLSLTVVLPTAGVSYVVSVWGSQYYTQDVLDSSATDSDGKGGIFTASLAGAAPYSSDELVTGNVTPKTTALYQLTATADTDGDLLTLTYVLPDDAFSGNAHVLLDAVAVSVIPEPSTFLLLGLGLASLFYSRSRDRRHYR
jgi:hypothetical protein